MSVKIEIFNELVENLENADKIMEKAQEELTAFLDKHIITDNKNDPDVKFMLETMLKKSFERMSKDQKIETVEKLLALAKKENISND